MNQAVWNNGAVALKTTNIMKNVRKSKMELIDPNMSMKRLTDEMSHLQGLVAMFICTTLCLPLS
ncbi:MAG TPA: hypothetical protein VED24_02305 [Candidatus Acidoferrum sp.]|nr:hypothetical protein [Candidatus Acidoferrum sp.]